MRTATIRTRHAHPGTVAAAVVPDNTSEMTTGVEDGAVVTEIERETTSGLRSTVDDYVVNVAVAEAVAGRARAFRTAAGQQTGAGDEDRAAGGDETDQPNSETTDTNARTNTDTQ